MAHKPRSQAKKRKAGSIAGWYVPGYPLPKSGVRDRAAFLAAIRRHAPQVVEDFLALRPLAEACTTAQLAGYVYQLKASVARERAEARQASKVAHAARESDEILLARKLAANATKPAEEAEAEAQQLAKSLGPYPHRLPAEYLSERPGLRNFFFLYVEILEDKLPAEDYPQHPKVRSHLSDEGWGNVLAYHHALIAWTLKYNLNAGWLWGLGGRWIAVGDPDPFRLEDQPMLGMMPRLGEVEFISPSDRERVRRDGLPTIQIRPYDYTEPEKAYVDRAMKTAREWAMKHVELRVEQALAIEGTRPAPRWHKAREQHIAWASLWQVGTTDWETFCNVHELLEVDDRNLWEKMSSVLVDLGLTPRPRSIKG